MRISRKFFQWWAVAAAAFVIFLGFETSQDVRRAITAQAAMAEITRLTGDTVPLGCWEVEGVEPLKPEAYAGICFYTRDQLPAIYPEFNKADFAEIQTRLRFALINLGESDTRGDDHAQNVRDALAASPTVLIIRAVLIGLGVTFIPIAVGFALRRNQQTSGSVQRISEVLQSAPATQWTEELASPARGKFFKRWALASGIFALLLAALTVPEVQRLHAVQEVYIERLVRHGPDLPIACSQSRGVEDVDYKRAEADPARGEPDGLCWYDRGAFDKLFPEIKDDDPYLKLYADAYGLDPEDILESTGGIIAGAIVLAILVSLASLLIGFALRAVFVRIKARAPRQIVP